MPKKTTTAKKLKTEQNSDDLYVDTAEQASLLAQQLALLRVQNFIADLMNELQAAEAKNRK